MREIYARPVQIQIVGRTGKEFPTQHLTPVEANRLVSSRFVKSGFRKRVREIKEYKYDRHIYKLSKKSLLVIQGS